MRNVLCFALLAPVLALAAGTTQPVTALAPENGTVNVTPSPVSAPVDQGQPNIPPKALVGTLDTIGGTTYDWWANGPRLRMIVNSPTYGVHALWMYSTATTGQDFPDRNMRYNFYDYGGHAWNWVDADYMQSGVNVYGKRAGHGNLDADPTTGNAIVGAHVAVGADIMPYVARDAAPGAGIFEYSDSMDLGVCQWPPISVGQDGQINIFPITAAYDLSYSHIAAGNWPTFSTPVTGIAPSPGFPTHNIAASKVSNKVSLLWEIQSDIPEDAYQMHSTDGGITWSNPENLVPPVAYGDGSDTLTSYHITSLFPWYDAQDKFHVVCNFIPMVNDTGYIIPSQIWHYCPDNTPQWSRIHIATCDPANLQAAVGYNAAYACRPSIGQDDEGNLFVAWEQFDSANVEATTSRLRADIFAVRSTDNGVTWPDNDSALKLTDAGTHSMRFPSVIDRAVEGDPDTMYVLYEDDSVAGFYVSTSNSPEGPATPNPVVVQKVSIDAIPVKHGGAVSEQRAITPLRLDAAANPNPFGRSTRLSYAVPRRGNVSLAIFDAVGRNVRTLVNGLSEAGRFSVTWDGRSRFGAPVPEGVYLYRYALDDKRMTGKLTLTR